MIARVGIVVPVHDEEEHLASCLDALDAACARLPARTRAHVVVVLDACTDRSESIARTAAAERGRFDVLTVGHRNVGHARAAGLERALVLCRDAAPEEVWLASTDADSVVPTSWLVDQLALASTGADAIVGTVRVHDWHAAAADALRFREFYDAFGGTEHHDHVHGANLGVRADAYRAAGGFCALATGEDHAIVHALRDVGRSVISTRDIEVTTSGRRAGRAPAGFAGFLEAFVRADGR